MYSDNQAQGGNEGDLRTDFYKLSLSEKVKMLNRLHSLLIDYLGEQASQQQLLAVETQPMQKVESAQSPVLPTDEMNNAVAEFDALTDDEQISRLQGLWG